MTARSAQSLPADRVWPEDLQKLVTAIFSAAGLPDEDAATAADALVSAEVFGVRTHGVANLGPRYLRWLESGFANATPDWRETRGSASLVNVDGDEGLGIVVAPQAMRMAVERARETGLCMVTIHNSRHLGMAGYHAMIPLADDMIGMCTTAVRPRMVPTFGREPRLGTNPIALAAPAASEPPFVFDAAMTTVAANKLRLAARMGETVSPGLQTEEDGSPVRDWKVPEEPFRLTPLGGTPEASSHKGYGLAAAVDILSAVLSQASFGARFAPGVAGHMVAALNIEAVIDVDEFKAGMDAYIQMLKATPPAEGHAEVLVAGEREHRAAQRHRRDGLPLLRNTIEWLTETAARFDLDASAVVRRAGGCGSTD